MSKIFFCILVLFFSSSCRNKLNIDNSNEEEVLIGQDYEIFKNTPIYLLAKAVQSNNLKEIEFLVKNEKLDLNYQEPRFGNSLLMLTVLNQQYNTCKLLLDLSANVNLHNKCDGSSAIILASEINNFFGSNTKFLKLLLSYGANPNDIEIRDVKDSNSIKKTPLIAACHILNDKSTLAKVKILIEAGADINYKDEFHNCVLKEALLQENMETAYYLLLKGADFSGVFIDRSSFTENGEKLYIQDVLNEIDLPFYSSNYRYRLKIIDFLKNKGVKF